MLLARKRIANKRLKNTTRPKNSGCSSDAGTAYRKRPNIATGSQLSWATSCLSKHQQTNVRALAIARLFLHGFTSIEISNCDSLDRKNIFTLRFWGLLSILTGVGTCVLPLALKKSRVIPARGKELKPAKSWSVVCLIACSPIVYGLSTDHGDPT